MHALRERCLTKYVPFARRQDNDDLACLEPSTAAVVIVHDFSSEGSERRESFATFWDWFRAAVEDMIAFEVAVLNVQMDASRRALRDG